jgi:hypothetical protein
MKSVKISPHFCTGLTHRFYELNCGFQKPYRHKKRKITAVKGYAEGRTDIGI